MACPPEVNSVNLTGKYVLNKKLSDDTDKILTAQGIGWMLRKTIAAASLYSTITHTTEDGVEHIINAQNLTGGIGSNTEERILDWEERDVDDKLFGPLKTKTKRVKLDELEPDFLKEGWSEHSSEHGVVLSHGSSDTPKSGKTWMVEIVWDIQEVNGERRYVRRIFFTGPKGENLTARQVFDYLGPA